MRREGRGAGFALRAARAEDPSGAACGGGVLLAPELRTAALNVKGTGNFLAPSGPLRCQELSVLTP